MKKQLFLSGIAALLSAGAPARAESTVVEGIVIGDACAKDAERVCAGVIPGEGRIGTCVKEKIAEISSGCADAILGAMIDANQGKATIDLKPGATPGLEVRLAKARDYAYCEIAPIVRVRDEIGAEFYNTTGVGCPPAAFAAIDGKKLSEQLGAGLIYMNPTPQTARRHWVMDQLWIYAAGETVDFDGVAATWVAKMTALDVLAGLTGGPYTPAEIHRRSKYLYSKGAAVFIMRSPDKKTAYVMQSYATEVDPKLTIDQLPQLGSRLKLPAGWTFEAKTLDEDLTVDPRNADGVAHIIRDDLHDIYEGCGFDAACNHAP